MKTKITIGLTSLVAALILSFAPAKSGIVGKLNPIDGAELVWVLGSSDSLKMVPAQGQFFFDVKPGVYKLVVDAKEPYKDVLLENLQVKQDETLDVGEIPLKQ
jgi:hypothetical protein